MTVGVGSGGRGAGAVEQAAASSAKLVAGAKRKACRIESGPGYPTNLAAEGLKLNAVAGSRAVAPRGAVRYAKDTGWVAEWFKAPVLKTGVAETPP